MTTDAIDATLVRRYLGDPAALDRARAEIEESGLVAHLEDAASLFWATVQGETPRGQRYNTGRVTGRDGYEEGVRLYALLRELRPDVAVETGVCNGVSTAFLLLALERNGRGHLYSIDLPEIAGEEYEPGTFWDGKGGAVIPPGREPGWMVPEALRGRWRLELGRSQDLLPPLLERTGPIDFFLHDSEHSYECMSFELAHAYAALREGGVAAADDVTTNDAFPDFARERGVTAVPLGTKIAFVVKGAATG